MMYSYTIQLGLTILVGPAYRVIYLALFPKREINSQKMPLFTAFVLELQHVQDLFFASNGFFILASAVASLVSLANNPAIFEIAEMQSLAFLQINSILVIFFCLVDSLSLFNPRVWLQTVVFVVVIVALGKSQLSSSRRINWRLASEGCVHNDATDYGVITPIPYPPWAVAVFGIVGMTGFWLTTLKEKFRRSKARVRIFRFILSVWILLIGLMVAGMGLGISMMWRQRKHLRSVAGEKFEDDTWGFGQVAALFVWAPIPLSVLGVFHRKFSQDSCIHVDAGSHNSNNSGCAQNLKDEYWKNPVIKYFLFGKKKGIAGEETASSKIHTDEKNPLQTVREVDDN